jgi:antitoxin component YwqK of YwqJK toxin-antitoxin module
MVFDYDEDCYTANVKYYYESGVLKTEGLFDEELRTVVQKSYYESGNLKSITPCNFDSDRHGVYFDFNGLQKKYYESGSLKKETIYDWNKKHGVQKYYYESSSSETPILKAEFPYVKDKLHGIVKEYYESGNLFTETEFENDKELEKTKVYFDSSEKIQIA